MDFILKIQPLTETSTASGTYTVVGVRGRMGDIPITLLDTNLSRLFFLEFLSQEEKVLFSTNESRDTLSSKLKLKLLSKGGISEEDATEQISLEVDQLFRDIEGSSSQRFSAMNTLLETYNMILLPLSEQNGVLVNPDTKEEEIIIEK